MHVTLDTIIENLRYALPQFQIDPMWAEDNLTYPIIDDLGRYICERTTYSEYDENDAAEIARALDFLERCLAEGDSDVRDLVHECLETLDCCDHFEQIKIHFGPQVLALWQKFFEK